MIEQEKTLEIFKKIFAEHFGEKGTIPDDLIDCDLQLKKIVNCDQATVKDIVWEQKENYYLNKAIVLITQDNRFEIVADYLVKQEKCNGHFENFPMLPFAILSQIVTQVCELLVLFEMNYKPILNQLPSGPAYSYNSNLIIEECGLNLKGDKIPLCQGAHLKAVSKSKNMKDGFILPNDLLIIKAGLKERTSKQFYTEAMVYKNGQPIVSLTDVVHITLPAGIFERLNRS